MPSNDLPIDKSQSFLAPEVPGQLPITGFSESVDIKIIETARESMERFLEQAEYWIPEGTRQGRLLIAKDCKDIIGKGTSSLTIRLKEASNTLPLVAKLLRYYDIEECPEFYNVKCRNICGEGYGNWDMSMADTIKSLSQLGFTNVPYHEEFTAKRTHIPSLLDIDMKVHYTLAKDLSAAGANSGN